MHVVPSDRRLRASSLAFDLVAVFRQGLDEEYPTECTFRTVWLSRFFILKNINWSLCGSHSTYLVLSSSYFILRTWSVDLVSDSTIEEHESCH